MFAFDENEGAKTFEGLGVDLTDPGAGAEDKVDVSLAGTGAAIGCFRFRCILRIFSAWSKGKS